MTKPIYALLLLLAMTTLFGFSVFRSSSPHEVFTVSIVAAHNQQVEQLAVPFLEERFLALYGKKLRVKWVKQGGQNTNIKLVNAAFKETNNESCGFDLLWGGGEHVIQGLIKENKLAPLCLDPLCYADVPQKLLGVTLYAPTPADRKWVGVSLSTFGLVYNKKMFEEEGLPPLSSWLSCEDPAYFGKIVFVDPSSSSSIWTVCEIIHQRYGWERAWRIWALTCANTIAFVKRSAGVPAAVMQGRALLGPTVLFAALDVVERAGKDDIGLFLPSPQETIVNADAVAILKGSPVEKIKMPDGKGLATICIEGLLSSEFQRLLILSKGYPGGPKNYTLGRMGVSKAAYQGVPKEHIANVLHPFAVQEKSMSFNPEKSSERFPAVSALFKACFIDVHQELKEAWRLIIAHGCREEDVHELTRCFVSEQEMEEVIARWEKAGPVFRKKKRQAWADAARRRYVKIIQKYK